MTTGFDPWQIDIDVRRRLADSIAGAVAGAELELHIDRKALDAALTAIPRRQQHPRVFLYYFDLWPALRRRDWRTVSRLINNIVGMPRRRISFSIEPVDALGEDCERASRLIFAEFAEANQMAAPDDRLAAQAQRLLEDALEIVWLVDDEIGGWIDAMLSRIYLAVPTKGVRYWEGATSLLAWGSIFCNANARSDAWTTVQFVVHEMTHMFALGVAAAAGPLVANRLSENYASPLRADPRPMDGVMHATLVAGRLATFNRLWIKDHSCPDLNRTAQAIVDADRKRDDGMSVISQSALLSPEAQCFLAGGGFKGINP